MCTPNLAPCYVPTKSVEMLEQPRLERNCSWITAPTRKVPESISDHFAVSAGDTPVLTEHRQGGDVSAQCDITNDLNSATQREYVAITWMNCDEKSESDPETQFSSQRVAQISNENFRSTDKESEECRIKYWEFDSDYDSSSDGYQPWKLKEVTSRSWE